MAKSKKVIGVLGGMGPYATQVFYKQILDVTPASKDADHIRLVIDSNTHIPSRNRHFLYGEISPVEAMTSSIKALQRYPVHAIYIPCNSASYFIDEINQDPAIIVPIYGPIRVTSEYILLHKHKYQKVAVWGAHVVNTKRLYCQPLKAAGLEYAESLPEIQTGVEKLIYNIKVNYCNEDIKKDAARLLSMMRERHSIDTLILGCTELSLIFETLVAQGIHVLDSNKLLAEHLVATYG